MHMQTKSTILISQKRKPFRSNNVLSIFSANDTVLSNKDGSNLLSAERDHQTNDEGALSIAELREPARD